MRGMTGREFIEPAVWWAVLFATYLAVISKISITELVVGALAAAAGAAGAVVTRRALLSADNAQRYRPRVSWLRRLLPLPGQILADAVRLTRPHGGFAELRLPDDDRAAALRGFATLVVSASPGTYVAGVDPDRDVLIVHRITDQSSALERAVRR
jgi:multisubunit Na+/H+ antiporter MnhE subunit